MFDYQLRVAKGDFSFMKLISHKYVINPKFNLIFIKGFFGDGYKCSSQSCDIINNCAENAQCLPDSTNLQYSCVCNQGFFGNGYTCTKDGYKEIFYIIILNYF